VVGWARTYDVARDVIAKLVQLSAAQPFANDSLQQHLDRLDPSVWSETDLLGFVRDQKGIAHFGRGSHELPTQLFGKVGLLVSGLDDFKAFVQKTT
jgi:hypothetical protein